MPRVTIVALVLSIALASTTRAAAEDLPGIPTPSLRMSIGAADAQRPDAVWGFAGSLDLGLTFSGAHGASRSTAGTVGAEVGEAFAPLTGASAPERGPGFLARVGIGYDRTGPGGRAARNFVVSAEGGYGTAVLGATVGLGFLSGRVDGVHDRGLRVYGTLLVIDRIVFVQGAVDMWLGGSANEIDVRTLAGLDVLAFAWWFVDD